MELKCRLSLEGCVSWWREPWGEEKKSGEVPIS
ncbi:hypothetical protein LCGC14_1999340, partial [marine sediment metagenome]